VIFIEHVTWAESIPSDPCGPLGADSYQVDCSRGLLHFFSAEYNENCLQYARESKPILVRRWFSLRRTLCRKITHFNRL
jgi:hypothetical protein